MTYQAAISGATGYAGGEILRLLHDHPDISIGAVTAHSSAGEKLGASQPHLYSLARRVVGPTTVEQLRGHDVVFLALPHGASGEVAAELDPQTLVIDVAADHRLESAADWEQFYGGTHQGTWPYGLPELPGQREILRRARRIAVPGCFPTTTVLALAPAFDFQAVAANDVVVVAATGTSGAGKSLKPHLLGAEVMGGMSPYAVGGTHRHTPEIEQALGKLHGADVKVSFTPTLAPMPRGILATCSAPLAQKYRSSAAAEAEIREIYHQAYDAEPFVHVLDPGQWPQTKDVAGSNHVAIQCAVDSRTGRLIVVAATDNLVKGTAGGAVQSMNLALGMEETRGLGALGVRP